MCFYVYAPNSTKVRISYYAEYIFLERKGNSAILADLLVTNPAPHPTPIQPQPTTSEESEGDYGDDDHLNTISSLRIIYPNRLFDIDEDGNPINEYFSIKTSTFLDDNNEINIAYAAVGAQLERSEKALRSWGFSVNRDKDGSKTLRLQGFIDTTNKDTIAITEFHKKTILSLYDINFSILTYEFSTPILPGQSRWIRLEFIGKNAAKTHLFAKHARIRVFTNSLIYQYSICGPQNIKEKFKKDLSTYLKRTKNRNHPNFNNFKFLVDFFRKEGLIKNNKTQSSTTDFENITINIESKGVEQLTNIKNCGDIERFGHFPDIIIHSHNKYRDVYSFTSPFNENGQTSGNFYINFKKTICRDGNYSGCFSINRVNCRYTWFNFSYMQTVGLLQIIH